MGGNGELGWKIRGKLCRTGDEGKAFARQASGAMAP